MNESFDLTEKEFSYISDTDFLTTKFAITDKIMRMFALTEQQLRVVIEQTELEIRENWLQKTGKISKGENYRQLPFIVLDYPRFFTQQEVFAFRSMFWWGNFFSCTLHLKGEWLDVLKEGILKNLLQSKDDVFICVNESPWEYYYGRDNYRLVKELGKTKLQEIVNDKPFLKISRKLDLVQWQAAPDFCVESLRRFLKITMTHGKASQNR